MTSRRPSCRASFPSLGSSTVPLLGFAPAGGVRPAGHLYAGRPVPRHSSVQTTGSPTFLGSPDAPAPRSQTPDGPVRQAVAAAGAAPEYHHSGGSRRSSLFRGSMTRHQCSLSTLRSMGCPMSTQVSLPAAARARLYRAELVIRRTATKGFCLASLHEFLLSRALHRHRRPPADSLRILSGTARALSAPACR